MPLILRAPRTEQTERQQKDYAEASKGSNTQVLLSGCDTDSD